MAMSHKRAAQESTPSDIPSSSPYSSSSATPLPPLSSSRRERDALEIIPSNLPSSSSSSPSSIVPLSATSSPSIFSSIKSKSSASSSTEEAEDLIYQSLRKMDLTGVGMDLGTGNNAIIDIYNHHNNAAPTPFNASNGGSPQHQRTQQQCQYMGKENVPSSPKIQPPTPLKGQQPLASYSYLPGTSSPTKSSQAHKRALEASEPTMLQLLQSGGGPACLTPNGNASGDKDAAGNANATGVVSWRKGQGFKAWEREVLASAEVKRKKDLAQLYFLDYYFDLLTYLNGRKKRLETFKEDVAAREVTGQALQGEWASYTGRERVLLRKRRTKLRLNSFHIITQVGQGGYGEVYLARKRETGEVCALKKMRKRTLLKMDEIRHVLVERDILTATKSAWLVKLLYAFQDEEHIYLAMEYIPGGDFRTLLNNSGVLKEEHARFYISEMFCAVDALHRLGYIHRDLKPENFLIDSTGHIKLTDFGLAAGALNPTRIESLKHKLDEVKDTELVYRSTVEMRSIYKSMRMAEPRYADSVVGSPDYMAIEVLRGISYGISVDYWSLGCILFEELSGFPPFSGASPEETWANLRNWQRTLRRPHYEREEDKIFNLSDEGWEAIVALIADKSVRFSSLDQIRTLRFFAGVPWETLRQVPAPFVPALDSEVDSGYFDDFEDPNDMAKYAEVREKQKNVDKVKEKEQPLGRGVFVGFTFKQRGAPADALRSRAGAAGFGDEDGDDNMEMMF